MTSYPSALRSSASMLVPFVVLGIVFGIVVGLRNPLFGVLVAGTMFGMIGVAQLQAAYRLNWALREFASQVPGDPEPDESYTGDQSLRWRDPPIAARGTIHRFTVRGFSVEVGETRRSASTMRPREVAREALEDLGVEPAFGRPEDRLPSIYPRLSALRVGIPVAVAGLLLAAALVTDIAIAVAVGLGVGVIVGLARWIGLVRVRRGLIEFVGGLTERGVGVERIDFVRGIVFQTYEVSTDGGTVVVRCVAHPRGRLSVRAGDHERSGRLAHAEAIGREFADHLPHEASGVEIEDSPPGLVRISSTQRLSSLAFGVLFAIFGLVLIARPGLVVDGECTEGCLLVAIVEQVPFGNVLFGGPLFVLGVVSLAIAFSGSMPTDAFRWWSRTYR